MTSKILLTAYVLVFSSLFATASASAQVAPDEGFEQRRLETLQNIAAKYTSESSYSNCVEMGFATTALVATIQLHEMGEPGGIAPADAAADIGNLADEAYRHTGTPQSPCTWENRGWPGVMHAALGLGYILNQWRADLPQTIRDKIARALGGHWRDGISPFLTNYEINLVAGLLLGGEALGYDSEVWKRGKRAFDAIYERLSHQGGIELNAPLYQTYHFPGLMLMLQLADDEMRQKARIALDYELIVQAHLYLPGGGLGAPQARDRRYGGALDGSPTGMHRLIGYLTGDTIYDPNETTGHLVGAVTNYRLPEALRAVFLDKASGYEFWGYTDGPAGTHRFRGNYDFGTGHGRVAPWHAIVMPNGEAMMGLSYGFRYSSLHASMGVYARAPDGSFPILYQYQPYVDGDTHDAGTGGLPSTSGDTQPGDFVRELYDYQRMTYGRSMISIWDPTTQNKDADVVRTHQDTRVHMPDYAAHGGQMRVDQASGWLVGKLGDNYIAYHPLGTAAVGPQKRAQIPADRSFDSYRDSPHYFFRLEGRSGGIFEMATADQFATIDDYLADLATRHISFTKSDPMTAEFDALDPVTGDKVRIKLVYGPSPDERRFVGGQEFTPQQALDHGLVSSPWVSVDSQSSVMRLQRGCHDAIVYDLANTTVTTELPAYPDCMGLSRVGPVFSPIDYYGDRRNFERKTPSKWSVIRADGDKRLFLEPEALAEDDQRLGEYALIKNRTFGDFTITLQAKTFEDLATNAAADYAVVFGFQDAQNYYYLMANATADYSELFAIEGGARRQIARASRSLLPDDAWHDLEISRSGARIEVRLDGQSVLQADDDAFGEGRIGVGSFNDAVLFDNIDVTTPDQSGDDTGHSADAGPSADAGTQADAGRNDAGPSDAGAQDATTTSRDVDAAGGCNCRTATGPLPLQPAAWLLAVLLILRLRTRNQLPE